MPATAGLKSRTDDSDTIGPGTVMQETRADIPPERIRQLNDAAVRSGAYVLYWMQASPRTRGNAALRYAVDSADRHNLPVLAYFGLTEAFPGGNLRHYSFLLDGLLAVARELDRMGVGFALMHESPETGVLRLGRKAALTVADRGCLRVQRGWYRSVAEKIRCPFTQVEDNVVVPVAAASMKEEYAAATLRPKITKVLPGFLEPVSAKVPNREFRGDTGETLAGEPKNRILDSLPIDRSVAPVDWITGGQDEAEKQLARFVAERLGSWGERRNDPGADILSDLSPYLHFGQIAPVDIACRVRETGSPAAGAFLEQLIVRRELAVNFVTYNPSYDTFESLPSWAKSTLRAHASDPREYLYTGSELENAETHDPFWNAAQQEMVKYGKMHGYMRMYWGKKILEWSSTPEEAYRTALVLNNRYELDGRDANGYAGVAWCFGKHDRPWKERPVFGTVRYMNANGLSRKFAMDRYLGRTGYGG